MCVCIANTCETNNLNDLLKQSLYINEKLIKDKIDFESVCVILCFNWSK